MWQDVLGTALIALTIVCGVVVFVAGLLANSGAINGENMASGGVVKNDGTEYLIGAGWVPKRARPTGTPSPENSQADTAQGDRSRP
jgi:hypothetical protein